MTALLQKIGYSGVPGGVTKKLLIPLDILVINVGFLLALALRFDGNIKPDYLLLYKKEWLLHTVIMLISFGVFHLYSSLWCYASIRELLQIIMSCISGNIILYIIQSISGTTFPRSCYINYTMIMILFMIGIRFSYRLTRKIWRHYKKSKSMTDKKRVMLVGAGEAGSIVIREINKDVEAHKEIILAVDDDPKKKQGMINGVVIKGDISQIKKLAKQYNIEEIIVAMPAASKKRLAEILQVCSSTTCELKIFHGIGGAITSDKQHYIRSVKIEDLLGREEIILDNTELHKVLGNKTILVTGGGGSIGSELCRQILTFEPKLVIIFDIYENNVYDLQNELLLQGIPKSRIRTVIGSVRDKQKLSEVFKQYQPQLVFHAAAHKHVPLMEGNPEEAIKNNVFGTLNMAQCAIHYKVQKFILISTDKAVNPTNVMGATKRMCEMIIQCFNTITTTTDFAAVRFGNVLGSNGSVIPLFRRQLENGGPLTVTHPDIIRYFMTIPEAVRLILQATSFAKGGEIFVLDMGEPVKILDLAKNFIRLSGFEPNKDIKIKFTGLRPGEKLYEELLMAEEGLEQTQHDKIFIGQPMVQDYDTLMSQIQGLKQGLEEKRDVVEMLMEVVPTYVLPEVKNKIS